MMVFLYIFIFLLIFIYLFIYFVLILPVIDVKFMEQLKSMNYVSFLMWGFRVKKKTHIALAFYSNLDIYQLILLKSSVLL